MSYRPLKASGTTTIAANTLTTLTTLTRGAGGILIPASFITNNVSGASFGESSGSIGTDSVTTGFARTATANQFIYQARNNNLVNSRTLDWAIFELS